MRVSSSVSVSMGPMVFASDPARASCLGSWVLTCLARAESVTIGLPGFLEFN